MSKYIQIHCHLVETFNGRVSIGSHTHTNIPESVSRNSIGCRDNHQGSANQGLDLRLLLAGIVSSAATECTVSSLSQLWREGWWVGVTLNNCNFVVYSLCHYFAYFVVVARVSAIALAAFRLDNGMRVVGACRRMQMTCSKLKSSKQTYNEQTKSVKINIK